MQKSCQDQAASQLTKNQIKKRRQKRSKLGKRDLSTASDTSQASTVSVINKSARGQSAAHSTCSNSSRQPQAHSTSFSGQQSSAAEHCVSVVQREDRGPDEEAELASAQHSSAAVALTEARQPGNTPQPASSSAPSWLGSRDCSSQAACIAATLLSRAPAAADPSEDTSKGGSKRSRMVFEHGNYRGYYGYRLGDEDDPRLQVSIPYQTCQQVHPPGLPGSDHCHTALCLAFREMTRPVCKPTMKADMALLASLQAIWKGPALNASSLQHHSRVALRLTV